MMRARRSRTSFPDLRRRLRPLDTGVSGYAAALLVLSFAVLMATPLSAEAPADPAFQRTWARTDQPVAEGMVSRTWMWGPEAFTGGMSEPYAEAPDGQRSVQYFDKSRMEITDPSADSSSIWYVTNGLLVVELITGRMQVGNASFEGRQPAQVNVAGDADDPASPTYATFASLMDAPALAADAPVTRRVARDSSVTDDPGLASQGVSGAFFDDVTEHTIASPFWAFMNATGTVYEEGGYTDEALFENPYFATGRPITEAYWATVKVGGTPKDVLIQCFERRCLTYTPDNPEGWQVEAGNVGRHYYQWRYERAGADCPWAEPFPEMLTTGDLVHTTLHFQVQGCTAVISRVEVRTSDAHSRTVAFEPAIPAWSVGPANAETWTWDSSGSFSGQSRTTLDGAEVTQQQQGSYNAAIQVYAIPQVGGSIFWIHGQWWEDGTNQLCWDEVCQELPWGSQHSNRWFWAVNTVTGAVGTTPNDVR